MVTVCVVVRDASGVAFGRVFDGKIDRHGIVAFGISAVDFDCTKIDGVRPVFKNCYDARGNVGSDWLTPFSTYDAPFTASCTDDLTGTGPECGQFAAGLHNGTAFLGPIAAQLLHEYAVIGESHGCIRTSNEIATFVRDAVLHDRTVDFVILDRRP